MGVGISGRYRRVALAVVLVVPTLLMPTAATSPVRAEEYQLHPCTMWGAARSWLSISPLFVTCGSANLEFYELWLELRGPDGSVVKRWHGSGRYSYFDLVDGNERVPVKFGGLYGFYSRSAGVNQGASWENTAFTLIYSREVDGPPYRPLSAPVLRRLTSSVKPGGEIQLRATAARNASCRPSISYPDNSGRTFLRRTSTGKQLEWRWKVPSAMSPGMATVTLRCTRSGVSSRISRDVTIAP